MNEGGKLRGRPRWQFDISKAPKDEWIIGETTLGRVIPVIWDKRHGDFRNGESIFFLRAWQQLPGPSIEFRASDIDAARQS